MAKNKRVIIVGAGPGGLTAGMLLQHHGYQVTVFEKSVFTYKVVVELQIIES